MRTALRRPAIVAALAVPALVFSGLGMASATTTVTAKGGVGKFTFTHTLDTDLQSTTCSARYTNGHTGEVGGYEGTPNLTDPLRWTATVTGLKGAMYTLTTECFSDSGPATTKVFVIGAFK